MHADPIAELLTKIRNGIKAHKPLIIIETSKMRTSILKLLQKEGYIREFIINQLDNNKSETVIKLRYNKKTKECAIHGLCQISKPGLRVYESAQNLPRVMNGLGVAIVSTSKGVISDKQARIENVGGEVIAFIW